MNASSGPEPTTAEGGPAGGVRIAGLDRPEVPRQPRRFADDARHGDVLATSDPLEQSDPAAVADAAGAESLLRCWVRENDLPEPADRTLRIALEATGTALCVPVLHWSATGWHRFGPARLEGVPADAEPVDAVLLAALLGREGAHRAGGRTVVPTGESAALVARVADSVRRSTEFLAGRRAEPGPAADGDLFLEAEQSLVLGHPVHPTPKSREGLSDSEAQAYSPELRGSFPLHWMAVDASVLATDSAWYQDGPGDPDRGGAAPVPASRLVELLAGEDVAAALPEGCALLPLHPWQARELRYRPEAARLLDAGLLRDLGPAGEPWFPTSSVRTVHRPGADAMLKLSLGLRITNSRRENLRKEALRGVEIHRLLRTGLAARWRKAHPGFDIVRDPAWLGVDDPAGRPVPGLDTVIRHNPFGPHDDAVCIAALTSPRPWPGLPGDRLRSRLADVVEGLAARTDRPVAAVAAEWFLRYLERVVRPVLWLDAHAGIALEAHQQNTLVLLDRDGWPCGGRYRDNQGYYFRASRREEIQRRLPGAGVASDSFVADDVTDERFAYYLGINNVLGLIGAFGSQGLAGEPLLLAAFRQFLQGEASPSGGGPVSPLPALLLGTPTLRCKANLLTRLHGMDELVGPVDTQSVYVTVANPLAL
ncbi:IucA/IucC family protein [Streptomyces sp. DSM 42041]|uniref:IucA/IucC family protein n=1 Tax=Streptomyces hazeniae TaxID=3075538 RepID=A0ABU2NZ60_9ACTN|nr:IucA/IucC family protein [Streptomyces sp. DSM 42041]MDT0382275.1 IucA/IucC family protein [Streptomyces sp. DSM 42041]